MTWLELAHQYFPCATEKELDSILWECTLFPFGTVEQVEAHLLEAAVISDGIPRAARDWAWVLMGHAMDIHKQRECAKGETP